MSINPPLLVLDEITKRYRPEGAAVLDRLRLQLAAGEYLAIMGESGSGKSTLLNLIAGLDRPDSGRVLVEGVDLATLDDDAVTRWRRASIGFVFQAFHILPYLTVLQNVALPLDLLGVRDRERQQRVLQLLEACGIAALAPRYARDLSGGELQRIAIARAGASAATGARGRADRQSRCTHGATDPAPAARTAADERRQRNPDHPLGRRGAHR